MEKSVFISFKTLNKDIVLPLYNSLKNEGIQVFMSSEDLEFGEEWPAQLDAKMREADLMLAFITPEYLSMRRQVKREWDCAEHHKKMILPVLYHVEEGVLPGSWDYYSGYQYICIKELGPDEIQRIIQITKKSLERGRVVLDAQELYKEACAFAEQKDWMNAVQKFERVADDIADAYPKIIYCRLMLLQFKEAREAARDALTHCPYNSDTYFYAAMANLSGRDDYSPKLLERSTELLLRAWEMDQQHNRLQQNRLYLAICIAYLYNDQSFRIPAPILKLVSIGQQIKLDPQIMNEYRTLLGV